MYYNDIDNMVYDMIIIIDIPASASSFAFFKFIYVFCYLITWLDIFLHSSW